jgi:DNA mismatch endonuclease (patch repair protein)
MKGKHQTEESKEKNREKRLHRVFPIKDTSIEIKVQTLLKSLSIKFEKHKPILGQPDAFIEPNICIFVDGCYWHNCEQCFDKNKFNEKQRTKIISDQIVTQKLVNQGHIVLRFWEHDINKNIEKVKEIILNILKIGKISNIGKLATPF